MTRSGLADSPFFAVPAKPAAIKPSPAPEVVTEVAAPKEPAGGSKKASKQASMQSSKHASMRASMDASMIEVVRRAVKDVGKESASFRFTPEEKKALLELTFTYKVQGYKTSENELARIAINLVVEDHKQNGRNSILEQVLQALKR